MPRLGTLWRGPDFPKKFAQSGKPLPDSHSAKWLSGARGLVLANGLVSTFRGLAVEL
jgi:hypothetical protein